MMITVWIVRTYSPFTQITRNRGAFLTLNAAIEELRLWRDDFTGDGFKLWIEEHSLNQPTVVIEA